MNDVNPFADTPALLRRIDKSMFEPKLTEAERCGILAAHASGVRPDVLALTYNLNRRTVNHIVNPASVHYKTTRKEFKRLGKEAFIKEYLTEELVAKIKATANRPELQKGTDVRANRKAGIHIVQPEQCTYTHRIEVAYLLDREPRGWYYRDHDSKSNPEEWFHNGEASLLSSQNCLALAEANLTDD